MRTVTLTDIVYAPIAREQAMIAFTELCTFEITPIIDGCVMTIRLLSDAPPETVDECLSYMLTASIESQLIGFTNAD